LDSDRLSQRDTSAPLVVACRPLLAPANVAHDVAVVMSSGLVGNFEVERRRALLKDALLTFAEPATTHSQEAAGDVVLEALRLYRRAVEAQTESRCTPDTARLGRSGARVRR